MKVQTTLKLFLSSALFAAIMLVDSGAYAQNISLKKKWETPAQLKEPESVLFDKKNNVLYVSNINNPAGGKDGNGSVGRVSLTGEIKEVEWVIGGMDAPKGLGLHNGFLYVADITKIVVIDVKLGKVVKSIDVEGAGMLNDLTIDDEGVVYFTDSDKKRIHHLVKDKAEIWLASDAFDRPNGVLAYKNKFYMVDMGSGIFYEIDKKTKALREIANGLQGGDGIVPYENDFIISNWNGEINFVSAKGEIKNLLDTKAEKINAADIDFIPELNLLLVPTFFANSLVAYEIVK